MKTFLCLFVLFVLNVSLVLADETNGTEYAENNDEKSIRVLISLFRLKKSYCKLESVPDAYKSNCTEFLNELEEVKPVEYEKYCYCNEMNKQDNVYWCSCCDDLVPFDNTILDSFKSDSLDEYLDWLIRENIERTFTNDFGTCDTIKIDKKFLDLHRNVEFVRSKSSTNLLNFYNCAHKNEFMNEYLDFVCELSFRSQLKEINSVDGDEYNEEEISLDLPVQYESN